MTNSDDKDMKKATVEEQPPILPPPPGAGADVESQSARGGGSGFGVTGILQRWKRKDMLKRASLALRAVGFVLSLLAFIIMVSNDHGDWRDYHKYEEYRYVLAIAILSVFYTGGQALRQVHELSTAKEMFSRQKMAIFDFAGDQVCTYLLLSAASSAVPLTNRMREGSDNIFTDTSAAAISMEFLAFIVLGLSALISGYKLSNQSYI